MGGLWLVQEALILRPGELGAGRAAAGNEDRVVRSAGRLGPGPQEHKLPPKKETDGLTRQ